MTAFINNHRLTAVQNSVSDRSSYEVGGNEKATQENVRVLSVSIRVLIPVSYLMPPTIR